MNKAKWLNVIKITILIIFLYILCRRLSRGSLLDLVCILGAALAALFVWSHFLMRRLSRQRTEGKRKLSESLNSRKKSNKSLKTEDPKDEFSANLEDFPDLTLTPDDLIDDYRKNSLAADRNYQGKIVRVEGKVSMLHTADDREAFIVFAVSLVMRKIPKFFLWLPGVTIHVPNAQTKPDSVRCYLNKEHIADANTLKKGEQTVVQGEVKGLFDDAVVLEHCWIVHED